MLTQLCNGEWNGQSGLSTHYIMTIVSPQAHLPEQSERKAQWKHNWKSDIKSLASCLWGKHSKQAPQKEHKQFRAEFEKDISWLLRCSVLSLALSHTFSLSLAHFPFNSALSSAFRCAVNKNKCHKEQLKRQKCVSGQILQQRSKRSSHKRRWHERELSLWVWLAVRVKMARSQFNLPCSD